jgi:hypothetical protein
MTEQSLPPPLRPYLVGFEAGGLRFLLLKKNVVAFHLQILREYRTRARIPVVYAPLIEVTETAIRRQRVERKVAVLKAKFATVTGVLIERLDEEGGAFAGKQSDVERAKRSERSKSMTRKARRCECY